VARRFAARAAAQEVSLQVEAPSSLTVQVDSDRLHRVLDNLVTNALRYTGLGGTIVLGGQSVTPDPRHTERVRLTVRDTGSGIPPERLSRIFDRFARANDDDTGFGLGLPIARQLVELHGGTISIDSQIGMGTTVTIDLPAQR
jgi:signal transduction histidine kinase